MPGEGLGASPLYQINPSTGEVTAVPLNDALAPNDVQGNLNGLEAISDTILLATTNQGELAEIDLDTGVVTLVGDQAIG